MKTLQTVGVDFQDVFPVPLDDERRRAGRQGLLEQEEDAESSDAEWVAFQHGAWCRELCACHAAHDYLLACIAAHVDPGTSLPPRHAGSWAQIETRARAEALRLDVVMDAILSDYADHFGNEAAQSFAVFVADVHHRRGPMGPAQGCLLVSAGLVVASAS
jgi:hypothetical protein